MFISKKRYRYKGKLFSRIYYVYVTFTMSILPVSNYSLLDSGFISPRCNEHDCFSVHAATVIAGENRVNVATRPRHEV